MVRFHINKQLFSILDNQFMGSIVNSCKFNPNPSSSQQIIIQNPSYQQYTYFCPSSPEYPHSTTPFIQLLTPRNPSLTVASIVITFCEGVSYDKIFTHKKQKSEKGSQTLVYAANESILPEIINGFNKDSKNEVVIQLVEEIQGLDADCTVFNWECCSCYLGSCFANNQRMGKFIGMMLERGHMLMFSDFSLKALIRQWNEEVLGPNPFVIIHEYTGNVVLRFNPERLKRSPSAQLQLVGALSEEGMCNVHAVSGGIRYTINQTIPPKTNRYTLEALTVASNVSVSISPYEIEIVKAAAGHCLLTYPKRGKILTSMTHWISLMQIDTSEKKIIEVARINFGDAYANQMELNMEKMDNTQKCSYLQERARQYVQTSVPCNNKLQKQKSNFKF